MGDSPEEVLAVYGDAALWSTGAFTPTPSQRAKIVRYALMGLGTPYSFLDYLSLALLHLHIRLRFVVAYVRSTGHMQCAQYTCWAWAKGGCPILGTEFTGDAMPMDLALAILAKIESKPV
jgi:hypothetical protein